MILTGNEIEDRVRSREIKIDPYSPVQLNPASYDVRLGEEVWTYHSQWLDSNGHPTRVLDAKEQNGGRVEKIGPNGFVVFPGELYLMHTEEVVCAQWLVGVVDGKSSIGRLGVTVHVTAGYIDPGFHGQITLEVATLGQPVRLHAGMRIAQLRFHEVIGKVTSYQASGNYTGAASMGPVPSRSWKQFASTDVERARANG